MKKSATIAPRIRVNTGDFKINTIKNRTILVENRGRIVFTKESANNNCRKSIYASK